MSNLVALAPDCIAHLLEYLSSNDIHTLLSTGDFILRRKVTLNVRRLSLLPRHNENFPFSALKLPHLKSLSVLCNQAAYLRFENGDTASSTDLETRNSTLSSLRLHFRNAPAFFCRPGSLSLEYRFPSLTELSLECFGRSELAKSLARLPKTLTKFRLERWSSGLLDECPLDIFELSNLPRTILDLEIVWMPIKEVRERQNSEAIAFEDILPPQLTFLSLSHLSERTILSHLPKSLENLFLQFAPGGADLTEMKTSLLPPDLTCLKLNIPLIFDNPLPSGLVTFKLPLETEIKLRTRDGGDPNWKGLPLPPRLEYDHPYPTIADHCLLKRVSHIIISEESQLDTLFELSKNKDFPKSFTSELPLLRILKPLPSSIKHVNLLDSMHGDDVTMLPSRLEQFFISRPQKIEYSSLPPSWTMQQVAELPRYLRELHIPFDIVKDGCKLAPISKLFLNSLELVGVPGEHLQLAPNWLGSCLPLHLSKLTIFTSRQERTKISPDCIRLCNLGEAVPHLSSFSMEIKFSYEAPMGPLFASLPSNLRELEINFTPSVFEQDALSKTPRTLRALTMCFIEDLFDFAAPNSMGCKHFEGLPPRLEFLEVYPPRNAAIGTEIAEYFPSSLCEITIWSPHISLHDLNEELASIIAKKSCPRYEDL